MKQADSAIIALLITAYRHAIIEPTIEAGYEHFCTINGGEIDYLTFCDAIAASLREELIRDPVRIPEGALQCSWHLELTPKGVALAQTVLNPQT